MALDHRRLANHRHRLDDIGIERALAEEVDLAELVRLDLEHVDEGVADDLALGFRIDDAGQPIEKQVGRIGEDQWQVQPLEPLADLGGFVEAQHAVVDEDAGEAVADRLGNQQRRHGRVDAAAQAAHDAAVADLFADAGDRLFHEFAHGPVARAAAHRERKVTDDLEAAVGVDHLGVEQQGVETPFGVGHGGHRGVRARRRDAEAWRRRRDEVAVARPDPQFRRHVGKQDSGRALRRHRDRGRAELAVRGRSDGAAEAVRHQLHAVANAKHRHAEVEHCRIAYRGAGIGHALRTARQDDAGRLPVANRLDRRGRRPDFRIDRQLAQATCDELRVLRSEVENDDGLMAHEGPAVWRSRGPARARQDSEKGTTLL